MYRTTTVVFVANINGIFDLDVIFEAITPDDFIIGMKYKGKCKGENTSNKIGCFVNQITLRVKYNLTKVANIKLFGNGKIQTTGIKDADELKRVLNKLLFTTLFPIQDDKTIDVDLLYNGRIKLFNDKVVGLNGKHVSYNSNKDVFSTEDNEYFEAFIYKDLVLLKSVRHDKLKKVILNLKFEEIGYMEYIFDKKYKNLRMKGVVEVEKSDGVFYLVSERYGNVRGRVEYSFNKDKAIVDTTEQTTLDIRSSAIHLTTTDSTLLLSVVEIKNMNIIFNLNLDTDEYIDLKLMRECIIKDEGLIVIYDNTKYAGLSIKYYYEDGDADGDADGDVDGKGLFVPNRKQYKLTVSLFSTGKCLVFGTVNEAQNDFTYRYMKKLFDKYKDIVVINKKIVKTSCEEQVKLTIYDLL